MAGQTASESTVDNPPTKDEPPTPTNIFDMSQGRDDSYEQRLLTVLIAHKNTIIDGYAKGSDTTFDLASFHASYSLLHFQNDFNAYLAREASDEHYAETFYRKLLHSLNGEKCDVSKCISAARNSSRLKPDATRHESLKCKEHSEIVLLRALDTVHVHCFHAFDRYRMLTMQTDAEDNADDLKSSDDAELAMRVRAKADDYERKVQRDGTTDGRPSADASAHNKFMTVVSEGEKDGARVDVSTFLEDVVEHLITHEIDHATVDAFLDMVTSNDFDTDALQIDACLDPSNIKNALQTRTVTTDRPRRPFEQFRICLSKYVPKQPFYSFGYRFYYWPFFADDGEGGQNEQNALQTITDQDGARSYYDRGNEGFSCAHWYIHQKFANLQDEILNNDICRLSANDFKELIAEAKMKLEMDESRQKSAEGLFETVYNIEAGSPLTLNHVLAVMLYCNFTKLCYEFSRTYRKLNRQETDDGLKDRHSNFYHFGKLLREFVEVFGDELAESQYDIFYHGINTEMLFRDCYAHICGPMSTTTARSVAMGTFAKANGIVVHFERDLELAFHLNTQSYSAFPDEQEKLFLGGFARLPFGNIYRISDTAHFETSVRVIQALSRMVAADRNSRAIKKREVKQLATFVRQKLSVDGKKSTNEKPSTVAAYPRDLFECFCLHREALRIDMFDARQNEIDEEGEMFGFEPFFGELFDEEFKFVDLKKMLGVFECAEEMVIERFDARDYEDVETATELMRFICDGLKAAQQNRTFKKLTIAMVLPMVEVNDVCTAKHKLEPFTTDIADWYECDLCEEKTDEGVQMFGCFNEEERCNYCLCAECYQSENEWVRSLKAAMAEIEPVLREMAWSVAVIERETLQQQKTDAICFSAV